MGNEIELNGAQNNAVNFPHTSPAVVTAAAGSGKTTLLVQRVIRLISDMSLDISADKLAIMTFTRNATKNMREKLNKELSKKIDELADKTSLQEREQYDYLKKQVFSLKQATISTIDAFCLRMIKDNAQAFDLPLNFSIADSAKKAELQSQALKNAMQELYGDNFTEKERDALFFSFNFENDSALENAVLAVAEKLSCFPDPDKWIEDTVSSYNDIKTLEQNYLPLLGDSLELLVKGAVMNAEKYSANHVADSFYFEIQEVKDNGNSSRKKTAEKTENEVYPAVKDYIAFDESRIAKLKSDFEDYKKSPSVKLLCELVDNLEENSKNPPDRFAQSGKNFEYKKLFNKIAKKVSEYTSKILDMKLDLNGEENSIKSVQSTIKTFFRLLKIFMEYYDHEKRNSGCIDFSDCERELYNKLSENGGDNEFRKQLSERFSCIIVDEFQDSNNIQAEIFRLLGEGRLFYVGDVKQSIYAFRGADPYIMAQLCEDKSSGFTPLPLNTNYRSRKAVIETVNAAFRGLMTPKYGGVEYSDGNELNLGCPLPEPPENRKQLYSSELYLLSGLNQKNSDDEDDKDMSMPRFVAKRIKELHDDPNFLISDGKDENKNFIYRRADYSDFIILLRTKTKIDCYRRALSELNILSSASKSSNFFETDEVLLVYNYLKIIDNPHLKEEALKVLMSPIYRFTAEETAQIKLGVFGIEGKSSDELKEISSTYRKRSFISCINDCMTQTAKFGKKTIDVKRQISPKLEKFYNDYHAFRSFMNSNSLDNLIRKIYEDTDLIAVVSAFEDSEGRVENIRRLQKLAVDFETRGGGALSDFLRFWERARENSSNGVEETSRTESSANAVRIMTFHGSKGLEAPICILAELQKNMNGKDFSGNYLVNYKHFMAIKRTDIKTRRKYKTLAYMGLSRFIRERAIGDELRLLYVAMTRAQEKLIMVSGLSKDNSEKFGEFINSDQIDEEMHDNVYDTTQPFMCVLKTLLQYAPIIDADEKTFCLKDIDCKVSAVNVSEGKEKDENVEITDNVCDSEPEEIPQSDIEQIAELLKQRYDFEVDTKQQAKFTATELAHKHAAKPIALTKPSFLSVHTALSGVETGNAYHHCLQYFPLGKLRADMGFEDTESAVKSALTELLEQNKITETERNTVNTKHIAQFFQSELGRRMLKAYENSPQNVQRERSFYAELNGRDVRQDYDGIISVQGQIDMFFVENGEIVIVDYKSDTEKNLSKELENYKFQVEIYTRVLKKLTGKNVKEMFLYALTDDKEIKV